jgi:hypothetical protein
MFDVETEYVIFAECNSILINHDHGFELFKLYKCKCYYHESIGLLLQADLVQLAHNLCQHF